MAGEKAVAHVCCRFDNDAYTFAIATLQSPRAASVSRSKQRSLIAAAALTASVAVRVGWALFTRNGLVAVDIQVYVQASRELFTGNVYDVRVSRDSPLWSLPFIYPPFAAILFFPLHLVNFRIVAIAWLLLTIVATYGVVRLSLALLNRRSGPLSLAVTAVAIWAEPVRSTLDYGQLGVFLGLAALAAAYFSNDRLSGAMIGVAAGIKLTPAIGGLYLVAQKRYRAAGWAALTFVATVVVAYFVVPTLTRQYFTDRIATVDTDVPAAGITNQSWLGLLARLAGHDMAKSVPWLIAVALTASLAWFAWRALAFTDRLGALVVIELAGLLVSPVSWTHHWVWLLPNALWLGLGERRRSVGARLLLTCWILAILPGAPWLLGRVFGPGLAADAPVFAAVASGVFVYGVVAQFAWLAVTTIRTTRRARQSDALAPHPKQSSHQLSESTASA